MLHYILTIQGNWNCAATGQHTITGTLTANGRSRAEILKDLMSQAISGWRKRHSGTSSSGYDIVFFSLEKNDPNV